MLLKMQFEFLLQREGGLKQLVKSFDCESSIANDEPFAFIEKSLGGQFYPSDQDPMPCKWHKWPRSAARSGLNWLGFGWSSSTRVTKIRCHVNDTSDHNPLPDQG